jgi:2-(1,2-epoxy-1,2-dihydrophenyl)acetyl-CoA isomerase
MRFNHILYSSDSGIARITLNRPTKLNSLDDETMHELDAAMSRVEGDKQVRVLILTGSGRAFCAGQDLADPKVLPVNGKPADLGDLVERHFKPFVMRLQNLRVPTVAAVNGLAAGAGASIALACDLVVATHSAYFLQAFSKIGLTPDTGSTWLLARTVSTARARGLAMLAKKLSAQEAEAWGMIWQSVEDDKFSENVESLAAELAQMPTKALVRTRHLIQSAVGNTLEQQLSLEAVVVREMGFSADFEEGRNAFLEKRPATFKGE